MMAIIPGGILKLAGLFSVCPFDPAAGQYEFWVFLASVVVPAFANQYQIGLASWA
jgi:hypothetical protein